MPYVMLFSRLFFFLAVQVFLYLVFVMTGVPSPWIEASTYWIIFPVIANVASIAILYHLNRSKGINYFKLFTFPKDGRKKDLLLTVGVFIIAFPLAMVPNLLLSKALWGSIEASSGFLFQKIPIWVVAISFLWPLTHPFAELPTYFDYCYKHIAKDMKSDWSAYIITSLALTLQHITLPLLFDHRYLIWRFGMFLLLAFFIGICIKLRPRLLPYIAIGHGLLDLPVVIMFLSL
ncbi:MAG TPA: hypothetical protein DIW48_00515 [Sphaerochaeta sp.]|nr:hypothetical protein [Sphaerochaeta sp.]